jgi:hypothetical protein
MRDSAYFISKQSGASLLEPFTTELSDLAGGISICTLLRLQFTFLSLDTQKASWSILRISAVR